MYTHKTYKNFDKGISNLVEDEILDHFEAEPLARFVYSRHEGQCYYSALTQCFYEVDHRTNLWVESKKGDILYKKINDIVKTFLCQKIQENNEIYSKSPREPFIGAIHNFDTGKHQI